MVAGLCHFVISSFHLALWRGAKTKLCQEKRGYKKTPREISKRQNNARRKDKITKCAMQNDEKRAQKSKNTMQNNAILHFFLSFFAWHLFAWPYIAAPRQNNAKRKDKIVKKTPGNITKRRNNARQKDGTTKCTMRNDKKTSMKRQNTPYKIMPFYTFYSVFFRLASFCLPFFIYSLFSLAFFVIPSFCMA